ncbi:zinc metallopeptidase [Rhodococcus phage Weasels2]|uniref:Zinc metallopeptidase n=1 Tax=Rhodococcus phage Weasels2 TaxID=1897437 RepID=A0A1I9SA48_9CAUD|nr:zinc metallopeptidase [Rhodococcus phage Weasels2]AOZ63654.1 zinc metallopeptidase [Rhodococcus phage Weasels2]
MTFNENAKPKKKRVIWKRALIAAAVVIGVGVPATLELNNDSVETCTVEQANTSTDCRIEFTASSLDTVWSQVLKENTGVAYTSPTVTVFDGSVSTACGTGTTKNGAFYCSYDQTVYIDTKFFDQLTQWGSSVGPLAQEYVLAHEFGHHIQNQLGVLQRGFSNSRGDGSMPVRTELQADCYAGVWATKSDEVNTESGAPGVNQISPQQLTDALTAAEAVGDDNIQTHRGEQVNAQKWAHGSSEQRQAWFLRGYTSGNMNQCDTYNIEDINIPK